MKQIVLLFLLTILISSIGIQSVWAPIAEPTFVGNSHFQNLPVLHPGETVKFTLKLWLDGPIVYDIKPLIDVSPISAGSHVKIEAETMHYLEPRTAGTFHVTITSDPEIPLGKIFLSAYFVGKDNYGIMMKGGWSDPGSIINVEAFPEIPDSLASQLDHAKQNIELRGFGHGILEFNKNLDNDFSCSDVTPKPETKIVERKKDLLLNIDEKPGYFFIILGQLNSTSYQYLQIGLHQGNDSAGPVANPSYFIDLKKQEHPIMGGLYQGDPSLAVVLESDKEETSIPLEENYKKYLGGTSKDVTYPENRLGPGEYDFHAILFQSDKPEWIQHDVCAMSLDWNFSVNDKGVITTNPPKTEKGKLSDVTKEFPPLQQHKKGVNIGDIECRYGLQLLMKTKDGTPACVKPESIEKLIEREWASLPRAIIANNAEISIPYLIDGGNITSVAVYGEPPNKDFKPGPGIIGPDRTNGLFAFIFSLQTPKDGKLVVTIPQEITGSIAGEETVLVDGREIDYHQIISPSTRTLIIDFTNGTGEIQILGSGYYKNLPLIAKMGLK